MAAIDPHVDPDPGASVAALVRATTRRRLQGEYVDPERAAHHGAEALYDRVGYRLVETYLAITVEANR